MCENFIFLVGTAAIFLPQTVYPNLNQEKDIPHLHSEPRIISYPLRALTTVGWRRDQV